MTEKTRRILLVEDNPSDVMLLMRQLDVHAPGEFEVQTAQSIRDGLESLSRTTFDVVLLDLFLPDASGLKGIVDIYSVHPQVPIIVLTGFYDQRTTIHALNMGASEYLCKIDIDWVNLIKSIRRLSDRKSDGMMDRAQPAGIR